MGALVGFGQNFNYAVEENVYADGRVDYTVRYALPKSVVRVVVVPKCPHIAISAAAFDARISAKLRKQVDELEL